MTNANTITPGISNKAYLDLRNLADLAIEMAMSHWNLKESNSW